MRLIDLEEGQRARLKAVLGGAGLQGKLLRYGLYPGDLFRVVRKAPLHGPILVEVDGREIALGRGVAAQLEVEVEA